jgi:hypothetical protein
MKYVLISLFSLGFLQSHAQKTSLSQKSIFSNHPAEFHAVHFIVPDFSQPDFGTHNLKRFADQSNPNYAPVIKQWRPIEYDPFRSFNGLDSKSTMVTVSSLKGHLGNIRISCDYMYDETGRLVDAVSSWNFGH